MGLERVTPKWLIIEKSAENSKWYDRRAYEN